MSLLKTNEIQNYNGSSLTLTASTVSTSAQLNTGGNISVTGSLNVSDDSTTRTNLGLGSIATQDSDNVTVTGGTATLGALTVSGSDSGNLVRITQTGSGNALVVEDSTNPDSTPFVVGASGNVGIGSSPTSTANLYVYSGTDVDMDSSGSGQIRIGGNGYSGAIALNSDGMNIYTNSVSRELIFGVNETEVMRVTDGNVGIGKEIPATALHVDSGTANTVATFESSDSNAELIIKDLNQQSEILVRSAETRITVDALNEDAGSYFTVFVDNDEKIRIDSSGNVGIGTENPASTLTVSDGSSSGLTPFSGTDLFIDSAASNYLQFGTSTASTSSIYFGDSSDADVGGIVYQHSVDEMSFRTNAAERMRIDSSGNVGAPSGTNIYNASDQRLKQNITDLSGCLQKVLLMRGVSFNWINDFCDSEADKTLYGLIAQELQTVDVNLVDSFSDNTITAGEVTVENPLRVNEKFIIPMLVESIKEQQAIIESQQSQIDALTTRIEALETT